MELTPGMVCRRLDFRWPEKRAPAPPLLDAVEAVFSPGAVCLITGETGAGKSTLLHLLAGLLRPTAGEIWADGQPVSRWPARHRDPWRRQVGIVFQHLGLMTDLSVAENLLPPLISRNWAWSQMQLEIHRRLIEAGLNQLADEPAHKLSGGQRQRLAIARALAGGPRYVFADEPTAYQDDHHAAQVVAQLSTVAHEGAVVVVCSHDPRLKTSVAKIRLWHLEAAKLKELVTGEAAQ
mgnify:FL=1